MTLAARLVLSLVLVVAGAGKLADRRGSRTALGDFGLPAGLVAPLALLLPLAEIAIGIALLPSAGAAPAATAAAVLFAAFALAIAAALRRGESPDCHCFGTVHSRPVTAVTLARAAVLAGLAALVAAVEWSDPGPSAVAWLGNLSTVEALAVAEGAALVAVVAGAVWLGMHLLRQNGRLLVRLDAVERSVGLVPDEGAARAPEGLAVGSPAPDFRLPGRDGSEYGLADLGERVVLVFADAGCGPCLSLFSQLDDWQTERADIALAVLIGGDPQAAREVPGTIPVLSVDQDVLEDYVVRGTPTGVLVEDGLIASDPAPGAAAIERLVQTAGDRPLVVTQVA